MKGTELKIREIAEKPFDRRSFLLGGGALTAVAAMATSVAYADEGAGASGASAAAASAAAVTALSLDTSAAESASAASAGSAGAAATGAVTGGTSGGNTLMSASTPGLMLGAQDTGSGSSASSSEWHVADDEIVDEVLQRLEDAEAENEQLRSDVDTLLGLLNASGGLPREVYVGNASSGVTVDVYPALWFNTADQQLYLVEE